LRSSSNIVNELGLSGLQNLGVQIYALILSNPALCYIITGIRMARMGAKKAILLGIMAALFFMLGGLSAYFILAVRG
jgi:hypothetical protein